MADHSRGLVERLELEKAKTVHRMFQTSPVEQLPGMLLDLLEVCSSRGVFKEDGELSGFVASALASTGEN